MKALKAAPVEDLLALPGSPTLSAAPSTCSSTHRPAAKPRRTPSRAGGFSTDALLGTVRVQEDLIAYRRRAMPEADAWSALVVAGRASPTAPTRSTRSRSSRWPPSTSPAAGGSSTSGRGEGQIARLLTGLGAAVVGIDPTVGAGRWSPRPGAAGRRTPAARPRRCRSRRGRFDCVVACLVFEHIEAVDEALAEVARVLAPGGRFVFLLNHPLLQTPGSGWIDDRILEEQYWRIGPYLVEDASLEEVEKDVFIPFIHRPLQPLREYARGERHLVTRMEEPAPPAGFLDRAEEYAEAATIPRLLLLRCEKIRAVARIRRVAGLSGAGRTTAADAFEDLGWYVIDNLPPSLAAPGRRPRAAGRCRDGGQPGRARRGPERGGDRAPRRPRISLREDGEQVSLVFLDAPDDVLVRRFEDRRRRHPLSEASSRAARRGREHRRRARILVPLKDSGRPRDRHLRAQRPPAARPARRVVLGASAPRTRWRHRRSLRVQARAPDRRRHRARRPVPAEPPLGAGPPTPHGSRRTGPRLRARQQPAQQFLDRIDDLLDLLLPAYVAEGKAYLTIAVGCTGGRHRSVAIATELSRRITDHGHKARVVHRDVER